MSQRESSVTDPVAGFEPALSSSVAVAAPEFAALDSVLRRELGLPREMPRSRPQPRAANLKTLLADLQTGPAVELPAYAPEALGECAGLSARQQEAVARALATPDLFLVQGAAGTGKSLVAAEIL